eukprot:m.156651 g.156651  ORF g.156651 m.156651 type:complete len:101 (-) comp17945_c0_seq3:299-601(-)
MEVPFKDAIDKLVAQQGVTGVVAADKDGLCIDATGDLPANIGGYVRALVTRAADLEGCAEGPVSICIESDAFNIHIQSPEGKENVTVAIKQSTSDATNTD